jgi:signal transduction histidine kinase
MKLEAWEQRERTVLTAMPFVLLGLCTIFTLGEEWEDPFVDVGLAVATAAWMLWWVVLHPAWRERPRLMGIFFVGFVVLGAALVIRAPWFGFFTWTGYFWVISLPDRWMPAGVVSVALLNATSQVGGLPKLEAGPLAVYALVVAVNIGAAGIIMFFAYLGERQKERQAQLVKRLEATLEENAGLHAQLLVQAREAGVLDERQRMARELHDTLAQGLAGIITQLEAAEQSGDEGHLQTARQLARDSLSEARRSVHAMRPEPLEAARLPEALAGEAGRWSALHGIPAEMTTTGDARPLRPEIEVTLLRAAQEALANVAKHASARRVGLTLSYMGDVVTLDVRDDGVGFAVDGAPARANGDGGYGLLGMRERVQGLAGTLEIESELGAGTALSVRVPAIPAEVEA